MEDSGATRLEHDDRNYFVDLSPQRRKNLPEALFGKIQHAVVVQRTFLARADWHEGAYDEGRLSSREVEVRQR